MVFNQATQAYSIWLSLRGTGRYSDSRYSDNHYCIKATSNPTNLNLNFNALKLKLVLTLVLTLTDTGSAVLTLMLGYRSFMHYIETLLLFAVGIAVVGTAAVGIAVASPSLRG